METQAKPQGSAVLARFALSFPILFLLSLGAHVIGGGGLPTAAGLFAGAIFSALFSALVSRSALTVVSVSIAALASQFMVHLSFHYVQSLGVQAGGVPALGGHHLHGGTAVDLTSVATLSGHAMFTGPMLAAHLVAGVAVAVVLVQVDRFLAYLRSAVKSFVSLLRPVVLIAPRVNGHINFFPTTVGIHVFLESLTKRGPPRSLKFLSI